MLRLSIGLSLSAGLCFALNGQAIAQPSTQELIMNALQACHDGRVATDRSSRLAHFERGQALGEQAVSAQEHSADAHFALFCNLGELMRIDGEAVSVSSIMGFRRMMRELDRALELAPAHVDALSARGTLLVRLPSLLGGDVEKGEQILRHVLERDPDSVNARISLAKSYCQRGRHQDALVLATQALTLAHARQQDDFIPEATRLVAQVRALSNKAN